MGWFPLAIDGIEDEDETAVGRGIEVWCWWEEEHLGQLDSELGEVLAS